MSGQGASAIVLRSGAILVLGHRPFLHVFKRADGLHVHLHRARTLFAKDTSRCLLSGTEAGGRSLRSALGKERYLAQVHLLVMSVAFGFLTK